MTAIPLNEIQVLATGSLDLSPEVLGDNTFLLFIEAFKVEELPVTITVTKVIRQDANLLSLAGTLPLLPGQSSTKASIRLYLFEVESRTSWGFSDRHCLILIENLPENYALNTFWAAFGTNQVTQVLAGSAFAQKTLLFSSLDYISNPYDEPLYPPEKDKTLSSGQREFLSAVQKDVTVGFTYQLATKLDGSASVSPEINLEDVLKVLKLKKLESLFENINCVAQAKLSAAGLQLILRFSIESEEHSDEGIPFPLGFAELGLAFPIQASGSVALPIVLLRGQMTFGSQKPTVCQLIASFDLATKYLNIDITDFPSFAQIEEGLAKHFELGKEIAGFLPLEGNGDSGLAALGSIRLAELAVGIDLSEPSLDYLKISLVAGKPFSLVDVVKVTPALAVEIYNPLQPFRQYEVDIYGQWLLGNAEIDTFLMLENEVFVLNASLESGSLNLSHVLEEVLLGQVKGLPEVWLSTFEFYAESSPGSKYYQVEIEIDAKWNIGDLKLGLDNVDVSASFLNGKLDAAAIRATLEIANIGFNLGAEYDLDAQGWTFRGGIDASINLGSLLSDLAEDLGVDGHNDFLKDFTGIDVTGFYLQYVTSATQSSSLDLFMGLKEAKGKGFAGGNIPLDTVFISFHAEGSGVRWRFDGTSDKNHSGWTTHLMAHIKSITHLDITLPTSIAELELKGLSGYYDSSAKNYGFTVYLDFGSAALVHVQMDMLHQVNGSYEKDISGKLILHPGHEKNQLIFDLELKAEAGANEFVAYYEDKSSKGFNLVTLLQAIDDNADFGKDFNINVRKALFACSKVDATTKSLFAIDMDAGIELSGLGKLPLIGEELAAAESLTLALQIVYGMGGDFTKDELQKLNQDFNLNDVRFPETDITAKSPNVSTSLRLGNEKAIDMGLPLKVSDNHDGTLTHDSSGSFNPGSSPPSGNSQTTAQTTAQTTQNDGTKWFPLKRSFGPLKLERVGFAYKKGELTTYFDGALSVAGLTCSVLGLNVGVKLTGADKFEPHFGLDGLGLDFQEGPVEIGGGLFKLSTANTKEFDGFVTIRTEELELSAIASFAELHGGEKSLFIYAVLDYPLGGPPFFVVTGLAAGFGYNRRLLIPPINQVQQFPMVTAAVNPSPTPPPTDMGQTQSYISDKLTLMARYIPPAVGEYFLTVGVRFTSFELVDSFLLATVQFGKHFEVDVLGLSTMLLPPDTPTSPVAEAQLALKAVIIPDEGIVLVQGQLTPASFILSGDCHLTGGFAFAAWSSGPHAGDFVVTIGGYHPDFKSPAYYPQVPRVGCNWAISDSLHVKGGGYFALVPHALMVGSSFSAVWQSDDVKASFVLAANFLIGWKPFHYDAELYVDLAADLTIHFFGTHHVSIDASADLHVWGPEFCGHARVTVKVIGIHFHFSIDFGASSSPPQPIPWSEFQSSFLPGADKRLSASIKGGLIRTVKEEQYGEVWVIKGDKLRISTDSFFPVKSVTFTLDGDAQNYDPEIPKVAGVAPMDISTVDHSDHAIAISRVNHGGSGGSSEKAENFILKPIEKDYPGGLWGSQMERGLNPPPDQKLVRALCGFEIVPYQLSHEDEKAIVASRDRLAYELSTQREAYTWVDSTGTFSRDTSKNDWSDITDGVFEKKGDRDQLLKAMGFEPNKLNYNQPLKRDTFFVPQYGTLED